MVIQWSTLSQTDPVDIALLADDGSQVCAGDFRKHVAMGACTVMLYLTAALPRWPPSRLVHPTVACSSGRLHCDRPQHLVHPAVSV